MAPQTTTAPEELLSFCKGMANENRQRMLFGVFIDKQPHTVGEVAERVGLAPSTTSEHLAVLKRAGILCAEKRDREVFYSVDKKNVKGVLDLIRNWLTCC